MIFYPCGGDAVKISSTEKQKKTWNPGLLFRPENGILFLAVCAMKIGSRAILRCEPCQVLTEAAVSIRRDVLRGCPI